MPQQYLNPLGFVDKPAENGATFILTNPEDSRNLEPGHPSPSGDTPRVPWPWTGSGAR